MITTKKIMTREVVSVSAEASVLEAYNLMYKNRIRHLPVLEKDGTVSGMLSDHDIQRAMVVATGEVFLNSSKKVSEYMSPIAFTALADTPITTILHEMIGKKISAVIIVDEKLVCVGIVTTNDIMRIFLEHLGRDLEILEKPISFFSSSTLYSL